MASLSESSLKSYEGALKKWWIFCTEKSVSIFNSTVQEILQFLTIQYEKGLSHSSLNCIRSAISLVISSDFAQDSRIKRFFKGISNLRPSRPKYEYTWDPKIVLDYYSRQPTNEDLNLVQI